MSFRRILWLAMTIFILVTFFYFIPVEAYEKYKIIYSVAGGILFFVCVFQVMGNFETFYDFFHADTEQEKSSKRILALAVGVPSIILIFIFLFSHSVRKEHELSTYGKLTSGVITGGFSSTTKHRFQKNTTYSIQITFWDSLKAEHVFQASVTGEQFERRYEGEQVDVVYSTLHPSLATLVLDVNDLALYLKIPNEKLTVNRLLPILEGKVKQDSILHYLNSINFEWTANGSSYQNKRRRISISCSAEQIVLKQLEVDNILKVHKNDFENSLREPDFKWTASGVNDEFTEIFYNERYTVKKQHKSEYFSRDSGPPTIQTTYTYVIEKSGKGEVAVD